LRSLRPDIGIVEDTLSELQKVGDELAANPGHRGFGIAGALHYREVSIG